MRWELNLTKARLDFFKQHDAEIFNLRLLMYHKNKASISAHN
jgi:hypothetical protein